MVTSINLFKRMKKKIELGNKSPLSVLHIAQQNNA